MDWWETILEKIVIGDKLSTPGRGMSSLGKKPFTILSKDIDRIIILSGNSPIPLEKECFEAVEKALRNNPSLWLRVASLHTNRRGGVRS